MSQKQVHPDKKEEKEPVTHQPPKAKEKSAAVPPKDRGTATTTVPQGTKKKEDLDKFLDEIDDVLEENAEEFVRSYVQRGGE